MPAGCIQHQNVCLKKRRGVSLDAQGPSGSFCVPVVGSWGHVLLCTEEEGRSLTEIGPGKSQGTTGACVSGTKHRTTHLPGGLVRNSWSGEKGPGPRGVNIRTLTMYVVSGCSSVSRTLGSRTIWCRSSFCEWRHVIEAVPKQIWGRGWAVLGRCPRGRLGDIQDRALCRVLS